MMIEDKKTISEEVIEGIQDKKITQMSNEEILELVSLNPESSRIVD